MKSITLTILFILILNAFSLTAQKTKREYKLGFSIGSGVTNLIKSEASHKIYLPGSEDYPVIFSSSENIKYSPVYTDYNSNIIKDCRLSISIGVSLEYPISTQYSFTTGIYYENKGINLLMTNEHEDFLDTQIIQIPMWGMINEKFHLSINNKYFIVPALLRCYFKKNNKLFIDAGIYAGYLLTSRLTSLNEKTLSQNGIEIYNYYYLIDNCKDKKKDFTNNFDFGALVGTGFIKNITDRLSVISELRMSVGLVKIDSKYNNEYVETPIASGTSIPKVALCSTNYYGLNSNSKNINIILSFGLKYIFNKQ
jgi:hypothetical protein